MTSDNVGHLEDLATQPAALTARTVRAVLILPANAAVVVPALILAASRRTRFSPRPARPTQLRFWLALVLASVGLGFGMWTMSLFARRGNGTPAPWDPPSQLVIEGPYRYVRNPMITSVLALLAAEAAFFRSRGLVAWLTVFFVGNSIYFPLVEEPGLERRFGEAYSQYKAAVPRWFPRLW